MEGGDQLLASNKDIGQAFRREIRKTKAQLVLKMARDIKSDKKGFLQVCWQQKSTYSIGFPAAQWGREPTDKDIEKAGVISASLFRGKVCFPTSLSPH